MDKKINKNLAAFSYLFASRIKKAESRAGSRLLFFFAPESYPRCLSRTI